MDDLSRRLLRYVGRNAALAGLRDRVRYGHEMTPMERWMVASALLGPTPAGRWDSMKTETVDEMVKLQPSEFDLIEAGVYEAEVDSVTPEDANPRFEDARPQLKFIFLVDEPVWIGDSAATEAKVFAWTGQTFGGRSKLRPWLAVLLPRFDPDREELETDDLVGTRCRIVVTIKKGEDGKDRNRVTEVLALETRRRGSAPPAQPAQAATVVPRRAAAAVADPVVDADEVPF